MSPILRKSLPFVALVLAGGVGVYVWKGRGLSSLPPAPTPPERTHSESVKTELPIRLAAVNDPGKPWQKRIEDLRHHLASSCNEADLRYLYQLLAQGPSKGESTEGWYVIANDLMEQLCLHDPDTQRLSSTLLGILHDTKQTEVLRDYAVQHLATWLNPRAHQGNTATPAPGPEVTGKVLDALVTAATDPTLEKSTIPGTTLMMLVDLSRSGSGGVDCSAAVDKLKPWLTTALGDGSKLSTPVRVSAIQAAGTLAPEEFRPVLRRIAYQENGQSSLQLPAIAALGQSGDAEDIEKLQNIARTRPALAYAAKDACKILSARFPHTPS